MSARPTWRVPEAEGAAAGGLVSQRSAEAGSAAEVKTALTRNRLRCTSALQRAVEVAMVSAQPVASCRPRSPGRLLGVMPSSVSETFRPRALPRASAASSGTGGRGWSPPGRAWLIDWAWPTLGAAWTDPARWILRLMASGGHTAPEGERLASRPPAFHG